MTESAVSKSTFSTLERPLISSCKKKEMHLVRTMGEKLEPGVSVHVSNETSKELDEVLKKKIP